MDSSGETILIGTEHGIFATDNGGDDWVMANQNMASALHQATAPVRRSSSGAVLHLGLIHQTKARFTQRRTDAALPLRLAHIEDLDEDVAQAQGLLVYPNPVSDANFTVQSSVMKGDFQLQVFDLMGRLQSTSL